MDVFVSIIILITTFLMIYKIYNEYKKSNILDEKVLFWIAFLIIFTPVIIYYIDRFNFPSKFDWFKGSFSDRWFDFISTYISSIFGAIIGAIVLVLITIHEFEQIRNNDNEQRRIENLPLISYDFKFFYYFNVGQVIDYYTGQTCDFIHFGVLLKNIGLNTIRKCYVNIKSDYYNDNIDYKIDQQEIIERNSTKSIFFKIPFSEKNNDIEIVVKYQDVLFNWYVQKVIVSLKNIKLIKDDRGYVDDVSVNYIKEVEDEVMVNDRINLNCK